MERETELLERLRRREARLVRVQTVVAAATLLAFLLFFAAGVVAPFTPLRSPLAWAVPIALALFVAANLTRVWLNVEGSAALAKRRQEVANAVAGLRLLREQYPELALLTTVTGLLEDEKAQASSRRGFWVNVAVSLFFTLLGFALSYTATKLGWLRLV